SRLRSGPRYRLKLTLWYINQESLIPNNTTVIKRPFLLAADANDEAFELALRCRGEGENVMLADRKTLGDDTLNEYAVGRWDSAKVDMPADSWEFRLHRPNPYFKRNTIGKVSGIVQVVRENAEDVYQGGSPLMTRSPGNHKHTTRHPRSAHEYSISITSR
ncbi:hypothetical protein CC86DRAFT_296545, partial [Ophiobolus disseminans]